MKFFKKLKSLILPKEINFFDELTEQSKITEQIIKELILKYTSNENTDIFNLIKEAKKSKKLKLKQLEKTFITPVDREAISRSYSYLYWIVLSVEHLINELTTFDILQLNKYQKIMTLLNQQIEELTNSFGLFNTKKYDLILKKVNHIIKLDNELVLAYSQELNLLFQEKDMNYILKHKEVLSQLKEISKRIHFCANQIEDIVFKID